MSAYNRGKAIRPSVGLLDICVLIPAFGAVIASFFFAYSGGGVRPMVNVKTENGEWVFPSDADETITVSGPLGNTIVEIREHKACIVSSPCKNQTCVMAGAIRLSGQWAACLPNRVMLYINEGQVEDDVDAAAW